MKNLKNMINVKIEKSEITVEHMCKIRLSDNEITLYRLGLKYFFN